MSYSAEPFAEASTTFERQLAALADRWPERRASHTATPTMTAAPSKIHSHRSEEADPPLAAGDGEDAAEDSEGGSVDGEGDSVDGGGAGVGATADAVTVGWTVEGEGEGLGDLVPGENVGGERLMLLLAVALDTAFLTLPLPHPAARDPAARIAATRTSFDGRLSIPGPPVIRPELSRVLLRCHERVSQVKPATTVPPIPHPQQGENGQTGMLTTSPRVPPTVAEMDDDHPPQGDDAP